MRQYQVSSGASYALEGSVGLAIGYGGCLGGETKDSTLEVSNRELELFDRHDVLSAVYRLGLRPRSR